MSILGEIDELKAEREAGRKELAAVRDEIAAARDVLGLMERAIAEAPQPQTWTVRIDDKDVEIFDRDAPLIMMAYVLGLTREKDVIVPLHSGVAWRAQLGDIETVARQILKPDAGGGDVSSC